MKLTENDVTDLIYLLECAQCDHAQGCDEWGSDPKPMNSRYQTAIDRLKELLAEKTKEGHND